MSGARAPSAFDMHTPTSRKDQAVSSRVMRTSPTGAGPQGIQGLGSERLRTPIRKQTAVSPIQVHAPVQGATNACCLFWIAGSSLNGGELDLLVALHAELCECVKPLGAQILEDNATSGLILCMPREIDGMTAEDTAVRLGQLLCQWAQRGSQPGLQLRVSVHTGELQSFVLPCSERCTYLGPVVETCKHLALMSEQEATVHLSGEVRDKLLVMRSRRMRLSLKGGSYYLEPDVLEPVQKSTGRLADLVATEFAMGPSLSTLSGVVANPQEGAENRVLGMSFLEFKQYLQDFEVDIDKFGTGDARTLRQLYNHIVVERESLLQPEGGALVRRKDIIRIQLLVRGDDCRLRELKIHTQSRPDGSLMKRDQKLESSLRAREGQRWKDGLQECFETKFGLSKSEQNQCLHVNWDSYKCFDEPKISPTVPGITTIYTVHSIVVNVKNKHRPELERFGLPSASDFFTDRLTGGLNWRWTAVGDENEDALLKLLQKASVDTSNFASNTFSDLYDEIYESCEASLRMVDGELLRKVRVIKVWLHADILATDHVLLLGSKIQRGQSDLLDKDRPLSMRVPKGCTWQKAVEIMLFKRLGMTPETQLSCIAVDLESHRESEEIGVSRSYPGIRTLYQIDEVTARVVVNEVDTATLHRIGLPDGQNFSVSRWEPAKGPGIGDYVITHWTWQSTRDRSTPEVRKAPSMTKKVSQAWWEEMRMQRRHLLIPDVEDMPMSSNPMSSWGPRLFAEKSILLETLMRGRKMDLKRARRAAKEICNPDYSCKDFYEDITAAFPELNLYLVGDMTSGRAGEDEYQRTLGAMFCFFWLMRLHLDGSQCFSFGLDENWKARSKPFDSSQAAQEEWQRRTAFHRDTEWASLELLLVNGGFLAESTGRSELARKKSFIAMAAKKAKDTRRHNEDRVLAMLVLTAIHDIMKTVQLLPTVNKKHGRFRGYKVGEVINDHDAALAYILEFYPNVLPSFAALPKEQQESVKFTQSKMEYNMGWLVQAEAPPGAMFRKFRRVVTSGQASPHDLAFYFTHWFTDLAGAEPFPQEGCEKFVLKFPKAVLNQFLLSFSIVQNLSTGSETRVYEDYLVWRWDSHKPSLGPAPTGKGSIAKMRLVTMAQGDSAAVLQAFERLPADDREVLCDEMSNVDIWNQRWAREESEMKGPAILVYYAPALMQKAGKEDPYRALMLLAEVFRQARSLWPLVEEARSWWVSVRVDQLKELTLDEVENLTDGRIWTLSKLTSREGAVQAMPSRETKQPDWATKHRVLNVCRVPAAQPAYT